MKAPDRKRLWGKSANRCAQCKRPLTQPGDGTAPEIVVGVEAHIVGKQPGSARYSPLPPDQRDAYENRILLCPTDHTIVDGQQSIWTVDSLLALKAAHEASMAARTANAQPDGISFDLPGAVETSMLFFGGQVLELVGTALAYQFSVDLMPSAQQHAAQELLDNLHDYGECYSLMLERREKREAAEAVGRLVSDALEHHEVVLYGALVYCDVSMGRNQERDRWPVAFVRARHARQVATEQKARGESLRDLEA